MANLDYREFDTQHGNSVFVTTIITREKPGCLDNVFPDGTRAITVDVTNMLSNKQRLVDEFKGKAYAVHRTYLQNPEGWLDAKS